MAVVPDAEANNCRSAFKTEQKSAELSSSEVPLFIFVTVTAFHLGNGHTYGGMH